MAVMPDRPPKSPADLLTTPVKYLKGVGPARAELLQKLGLATARDVLFFFPRDYEDLGERTPIDRFQEGVPVSVVGVVEESELRPTGTGKSMLGVLIRQDQSYLRAIWFNQSYLHDQFKRGRRVLLMGTPKMSGMRWELVHPKHEFLEENEEPPTGRVLPVYPLTEGLNQGMMRKIVGNVVELCTAGVDEALPESLLDEYGLWPIGAALPQIHQPTDRKSLEPARRRFIFQELLVMQLALAIRRQRLTHAQSPPLPLTAKIDARIERLLPFEVTPGPRRAIQEIGGDLAQSVPMNRLLQGEVGSGKTVVAVYALLIAVAHGWQGALMAPTEVLARQHRLTLEKLLTGSKVRIGQLVGGLTAGERQRTLEAIKAGDIDLVIGTQAIVQAGVEFARLGLVVIDEQHKFGVRQRAMLKQAALAPHYLVMTATPIPRTLTMTQYGDLDVSTLKDAPPGRQPVNTYLATDGEAAKWWEFVRTKLREGRQAYVIAPLVEESELRKTHSTEQLFEELANGELADFRVELLHGRMTSDEKEAAMDRFRRGEIQVLVATSVVEVGIDVPNATLLTVMGGEWFGLAQLHQLRGRVSRGVHSGYVCVFAGATNEEARQRLAAFTKTSDGFEIAELDFTLRGPGDLFGTKQHGLPPLRIADLVRDSAILQEARTAAQKIIATDPELSRPKYALLKRQVFGRYGAALELGDVG
jgi:ATP-dependent DNA helicase RecG